MPDQPSRVTEKVQVAPQRLMRWAPLAVYLAAIGVLLAIVSQLGF